MLTQLRNQREKVKQFLNEYFSFKNSLENLMNFTKKYYIFFIDFSDMHFKNRKRFKIIIAICVMLWMVTFHHLLIVTSNDFYSMIDGSFLPDFTRTVLLLLLNFFVFASTLRTDLLIGEISFNLKPLEVFYFLMQNIESKHRLTDANYKKLAILSRIIQMIFLNYVSKFLTGLTVVNIVVITINSQRFIFYLLAVLITPFYVILIIIMTSCCCVIYIYFLYYKLIFDQINDQFKCLFFDSRSKIIFKSKENQLIQLINEHNLAAIQVHKMNLILRRTSAVMFITYSFAKMITLFLIMNLRDHLMKILIANVFMILLIFGFGVSILYSLQVKSAHKSYQLFHLIVCRYKIRFLLRLKVN